MSLFFNIVQGPAGRFNHYYVMEKKTCFLTSVFCFLTQEPHSCEF